MLYAEPRSPLGENFIRWETQLPASVSKMQTPGDKRGGEKSSREQGSWGRGGECFIRWEARPLRRCLGKVREPVEKRGVRRDMDKGAEVGCAWHVRRTNKEETLTQPCKGVLGSH